MRRMDGLTQSDREFLAACRNRPTQANVARFLGVSKAAVSQRLKRLRAKGVDVPEFKRGRPSVLPIELQVTSWEWVRGPLHRTWHRRRPGESTALCGSSLPEGVDVRTTDPPTACRRCWPAVGRWEPKPGPVPERTAAGCSTIVVERSAGLAGVVEWCAGEWVDVETSAPMIPGAPSLRWWPLRHTN